MEELTLNEEPNIGHPYASRDRYDEPLPIPYGDADGTYGQIAEDVHAEYMRVSLIFYWRPLNSGR
jgi:hypothetical protein